MNIPFPMLTPSLLDPSFFNPDSPIDEDAELTALEREYQAWLNHIAQEKMKNKVQKPRPTPMETANTVEVAISSTVNVESDESEETHDEDEEEIVPSYSPPGNNEDTEPEEDTSDDAETVNEGNQSGLWLGLPP